VGSGSEGEISKCFHHKCRNQDKNGKCKTGGKKQMFCYTSFASETLIQIPSCFSCFKLVMFVCDKVRVSELKFSIAWPNTNQPLVLFTTWNQPLEKLLLILCWTILGMLGCVRWKKSRFQKVKEEFLLGKS